MKSANNRIYEQLKEKVLPALKFFKNDLIKHDKKIISDNPETPFLHYTRDSGTHIIMFNPPEAYPEKDKLVPYLFGKADRDELLYSAIEMAQYFLRNKRDYLFVYYFNGKKLKQISFEYALDLATNYVFCTKKKW